jgi:hypothetical protein
MGIMKGEKKNDVKHLEKPSSLLCLVSLPSTTLKKKALLKKALRNKVIRKVTHVFEIPRTIPYFTNKILREMKLY